jgi:hypothetical protein
VNEILILLLGWLLGVVSPAIVEAIRSQRETRVVRSALREELEDLCRRIALGCHVVRQIHGTVDRKHLEWLKGALASFSTLPPLDESFEKSLELQLSMSDAALRSLTQSEENGQGTPGLKKYSAPLLDSRILTIWQLKPSEQRALVALRSHLSLLNEEVERSRVYSDLTLTLDGTNHAVAVANARSSQESFCKQAVCVIRAFQAFASGK